MTTSNYDLVQDTEVIVYDPQLESDNQRFAEDITKLPHSTPIKPWSSDKLSDIIREATNLGIYTDKIPKYNQEAQQLGLITGNETLRTVIIQYPWKIYNRFLVVPPSDVFYKINYSRNACIISDAEQKAIANAKVGIAGLSVGGVVGTLLVRSGFLNIIGIDGGLVDGKDLNRSGFGQASSVGFPQAYSFKRSCLEINPFANIVANFAHLGSKEYSVEDFVRASDVVIDEVDALDVKWDIRVAAKRQNKAVFMGTDLGSSSLIQIEPPNVPPFFGRISSDIISDYKNDRENHQLKTQIAIAMIGGVSNVPHYYVRALEEARNKNLGYWPQVGEAAFLTASLLSKAIRSSLTGQIEALEVLVDLDNEIGRVR